MTLNEFNVLAHASFEDNASNNAVIARLNRRGVTPADWQAFSETSAYKNHGRGYHVLREFSKWFCNGKPDTPAPSPKPTPKPVETKPAPASAPAQPTTPTQTFSAIGTDAALLAAMRAFMGSQPATLNEEQINKLIDARVDERVNAAIAATKPSRIIIESPKGTVELPKGVVLHKKFKQILQFVTDGIPVYLYGPSGSGKSQTAKQVAEALNLPYYFTGKVDFPHDLLGYNDAGGNYVETQFYKAVKNGGLFLFDEIDASSEEALTAFNAVLNSGECAFPCGTIQAHENFRVMAAGNTCGQGGTGIYNARRKLDGATLDRFVPVYVDYDPQIESALGDDDTVQFVRVVRKAAERAGIELIMSYRSIKFLSKYVPIFGAKDAVQMKVLTGLSDDDKRTLKNDIGVRELMNNGNKLALAM